MTVALHVVYVEIRRERVQSGNGMRERHSKLLEKSLLYTYKRGKNGLGSFLYGQE